VEQAPPKASLSKRVISAAFILFFLLIILALLLPNSGLQKGGYHLQSWSNMKQIALAVYQYQLDHDGATPQKLSQLDRKYVEPEQFFYQSKYNTSVCFIPANIESHPELIELFSPYSFVVLPDKRIIVWEHPGMWIDNRMGYFVFPDDNRSSDIFQAFRSDIVTTEEFEKRFLAGFH
jgi:hypothetical protein